MQQIAMPQPSLDIVKTATDSLLLPLRRPILFVPFAFTLAMLVVMIAMVVMGTASYMSEAGRIDLQHIIALAGAAALSIFTSIIAVEVTIIMTAQAEVGKELDLAEAVSHSLSRLPVTLATTAVMVIGIMVGTILLVIPGVILMIRWWLAPNMVLLTRRGMREALGMSWRIAGAYFGPLLGLTLLVGVGTVVLSIPLGFIPVVGQVAAGWLGFAWAAMAMAMAHVRLGLPVEIG